MFGGADSKIIDFNYLDIALVAHFRPKWAPFWNRTRIFRFKTFETSGGIILRQVPAEDIENEYTKARGLSH
jgi:hypothetical protein